MRREVPRYEGVYIRGSLQDEDVIFTVDTGATTTIVSSKVYGQIPEDRRPRLHSGTALLACADGRSIKYLGKALFDVKLGSLSFRKMLSVAAISDDVLLGADFLQKDSDGPADLLLSEGRMKLRGVSIPLEMVGVANRARRVTLADHYVIPPMTEAVVDVFIDRSEYDEDHHIRQMVIEPISNFSKDYSLIMAPTLVDLADNVTVKARLLNPFSESVSINQDAVIGLAEPIDGNVSTLKDFEDGGEIGNDNAIRRIALASHTNVMQTHHDGAVRHVSQKCNTNIPLHLQKLFDVSSLEKTEGQVKAIGELLNDVKDVFSKDDYDLGRTHLAEHSIDTGDAKPIKQPPRRLPMAFAGEDRKAIEKLQMQGSIRPSTSPWASPIVLVRKKDGSVRPCVDYRRVNAVTRKDAFPLPRTQDCLDALSGSIWFSSMDITSAYNQVPVAEKDIPKTAFVTRSGLYEFTTMPFGLCNAPATFERVMELALSGLQWTSCLIYLDDVIVFGSSFDEHMSRLRLVLERIKLAGLKLKPSKCHFFQDEVVFLGHVISKDGILPNPDNVAKIVNWPVPETVSHVRTILGMGSYYRRFVKNFSKMVHPLTQLTKKDQKFKWSSECQDAFDSLKRALTGPEIMAYPSNDCPFVLDTDACDVSIGAVLSQVKDGKECAVAYASRSLNKAEKNYCVTDRELLAIRYFVEYFKQYLLGRKFTVRSDHQALKWLFSLKEPKSRIARWIEVLSAYDFEVEFRPGHKHGNADAMSRCPNPRECHCDDSSDDEVLRCGPCRKCYKRSCDMQSSLIHPEVVSRVVRDHSWKQAWDAPILKLLWCKGRKLWHSLLMTLTCLFSVGALTQLSRGDNVLVEGSKDVNCLLGVSKLNLLSRGDNVVVEAEDVKCRSRWMNMWLNFLMMLTGIFSFGELNWVSWDDNTSDVKKKRCVKSDVSKVIINNSVMDSICSTVVKTSSFVRRMLTLSRGLNSDKLRTVTRSAWLQGFSMVTLRKKQLEDSDIGPILRWFQSGKRPYGPDVCSSSPATRHFWNCWDNLFIKEGVLFRKFVRKDCTGSHFQFIVPKSLRDFVLKQMHDALLSGHLGRKKTKEKVLQRFYWFNVRQDVNSWVQRCDICAASKPPSRTPRAPLGDMRVGAPMDRLATDILGPFPLTERGNRYILVVTDYFTNWVEIFPVPDQTAVTCAEKILHEVICRFGCPIDLHSDQGSNYESIIFAELCKMLEIRKTRSSPRNPKCNGKVERFNRTLIRMIRAYLRGEQRNWDLNLSCLAAAYRATPHEGTGLTPNLLMLGREVRLPAEVVFGSETSDGSSVMSYGEYVDDLCSKMKHAHEVAREHLKVAAQRQKVTYDAKCSVNKYSVGDYVWYLIETRKPDENKKLNCPFVGPFVVVHKMNDLDYMIQMDVKGTRKVVHHNKLKPYEGDMVLKWANKAVAKVKKDGVFPLK